MIGTVMMKKLIENGIRGASEMNQVVLGKFRMVESCSIKNI